MIAGTTGVGIWLYRLGLGWLLGDRFLLLTHRDRWSRETRATVLDVLEADTRDGRYVVAATAGDQPGWLLDVARDPRVHVNIGADSFAAVAASLVWSDTATLVEFRRVSRTGSWRSGLNRHVLVGSRIRVAGDQAEA